MIDGLSENAIMKDLVDQPDHMNHKCLSLHKPMQRPHMMGKRFKREKNLPMVESV